MTYGVADFNRTLSANFLSRNENAIEMIPKRMQCYSDCHNEGMIKMYGGASRPERSILCILPC